MPDDEDTHSIGASITELHPGGKFNPRPSQPYQPGNLESVRHGADSERLVAAKAREVHENLREVAPWLSEEHFAPALLRYLRAAAREELLHKWIMEHSEGDELPSARVFEQATAAARLSARLGQDLGLDPIGHARLKAVATGAEIANVTLGDLLREGEKILNQRPTGLPRSADTVVIEGEAVDDEGD